MSGTDYVLTHTFREQHIEFLLDIFAYTFYYLLHVASAFVLLTLLYSNTILAVWRSCEEKVLTHTVVLRIHTSCVTALGEL